VNMSGLEATLRAAREAPSPPPRFATISQKYFYREHVLQRVHSIENTFYREHILYVASRPRCLQPERLLFLTRFLIENTFYIEATILLFGSLKENEF
jgi:hypothetical protein